MGKLEQKAQNKCQISDVDGVTIRGRGVSRCGLSNRKSGVQPNEKKKPECQYKIQVRKCRPGNVSTRKVAKEEAKLLDLCFEHQIL